MKPNQKQAGMARKAAGAENSTLTPAFIAQLPEGARIRAFTGLPS
ncbi:hypothetical protein [Zobellella sp. DQSA1]